ncbi:molybdopterin-dependent oxidoreductase [Nocardia sp. 2]|uniref:Molybdopterin-dependent oxidoreductase n=1 Tax=Nocardia acididurans TaxID=2802282 RepID=A0ABS1M683_9NOCA|nr:molybdopterin-dependent oxidoreductase [Nocardia acididurans]MBL1076157.1 molybdopterin-dependent oxidoreductase [Nocardia acididurans]
MTGRGLRVAAGVVSAGVILGVAELVAVLAGAESAPLPAVGDWVVDQTPDGVREWAIDTFGTSDKTVLFLIMGVVAVVVAALAGLVERTRRPVGSVLFVVFGGCAALAALTRPQATWTWIFPAVLGTWAGIIVLRSLIRRIEDFERAAGTGSAPADAAPADPAAADVALERRIVVRGLVIGGAAAAGAGLVGRLLGASSRNVAGERAEVTLPSVTAPLPEVDPGADLRIPGLTSYLTPNADFYRIDTALVVPQVSKEDWSLRIHGMVDREIRLTYADLAARTPIERLVTLACVSNEIGGDLIGNALWLGYRLDELLAEAVPHPEADMVLSRSKDGWTAGSPLSVLTDGRDAMLAVGMNGEALPVVHGYPARLVVPGLYGYVSATKWVTELEVTRFDRAQAYWTKRGWSAYGPIKTGTRIDVPSSRKSLTPGRITVAGVAWAQHRGIRGVEVRIDQGEWQPARLAVEPSIDTWRQWAFDWEATPGTHTIWARATDGAGETQTEERRDVIPDGATGYPSITLQIR